MAKLKRTKWHGPIGYTDVLHCLGSAMGKLKTAEELFKSRHFDRAIVILCVRWVQRYAAEFEKRRRRFARASGRSWRVDETYVKIRGKWCYLYRAVDLVPLAHRDAALA